MCVAAALEARSLVSVTDTKVKGATVKKLSSHLGRCVHGFGHLTDRRNGQHSVRTSQSRSGMGPGGVCLTVGGYSQCDVGR